MRQIRNVMSLLSPLKQTYVGRILLSMNPFKKLAFYTPSIISLYQQEPNVFDLPPHVWVTTPFSSLMSSTTDMPLCTSLNNMYSIYYVWWHEMIPSLSKHANTSALVFWIAFLMLTCDDDNNNDSYALTEYVFKSMTDRHQDQAIVITGETASGKTG